jgi:hypothetical protein
MADYDRTKICSHLRSKNMYFANDAGHACGTDTTDLTEVFWCTVTMRNCGPDDHMCDCTKCIPGRACFRSVFDNM